MGRIALKALPYVLVLGAAVGIYKTWEGRIRADERYQAESAEMRADIDSLAARLVRDSVVIDSLQTVASAAAARADSTEALADSALAAADSLGERVALASANVDSALAVLPAEVRVPLAAAVYAERRLREQETDSLRTAAERLRSSNADLRLSLSATQTQLAIVTGERDDAIRLNADLQAAYEREYKKANPGFLGRMTRDLPEKLAWSAATIALDRTIN